MPDSVQLYALAQRSYERGRARAAMRVIWIIVPLAALCARETSEGWRCAVVAAALLLVSFGARWRLPHGVHAIDAGLVTGIIPMTAALVLCRFAPAWPDGAALGICTAAGFVSGLLAGNATRESTVESRQWRGPVTAAVVAGLTGALGCVGIGTGTAIGGTAAVVLGSVVVWKGARHASA
jgi:hypothetical protein